MRSQFVIASLLILLLAGCNICPPCPPTPTPVPPTATPVVPDKPACWDPRLDTVGVTLERRNGSYELVAAWTTINGDWDNVVPCAKPWQRDTLGGDHNAFGRVETASGAPIMETFALVWGVEGDTRTPEADGWANIPIYGGGGKYDWFPYGGDKLHGLNMPGNAHWSFFGVWQPRRTLHEIDEILMEMK